MGFFELFSTALAGFFALVPSYGLAIILLTVCVRLLLLPLSIKQTRSMREMQRIQPEVKRLQQKHKGNRQKMNEEMMALYKEHGVNPFGGCGPMVLQIPVMIGLFYVIRSPLKYLNLDHLKNTALASALREDPLGVHEFLAIFRLDCSPQEVFNSSGSSIVETACGTGFLSFLPYAALILLMGWTTYYQQRQMQASRGPSTDATAQQMQLLGKIMPVMLMVFSYNFPAGVVLYWLAGNVWMIGQQRLMLRAAPPLPAMGKGGGSKGPDDKAKKAGGANERGDGKQGKGKLDKGASTKAAKTASAKSNGKGAKVATGKGSGDKGKPSSGAPKGNGATAGAPPSRSGAGSGKRKRKR